MSAPAACLAGVDVAAVGALKLAASLAALGASSIPRPSNFARSQVLALEPMCLPKDALASAREDWIADTEGGAVDKRGNPVLDKDKFFWSWFELADLWTDSIDPEDYVTFMEETMGNMTVTLKDGTIAWEDDKIVLRRHFDKRRRDGKKNTPTYNLPLARSRWYGFFRLNDTTRDPDMRRYCSGYKVPARPCVC